SLARQIYRAAGIAISAEDTIRATQQLDVVIHRHIDLREHRAAAGKRAERHATVDLDARDLEAARIKSVVGIEAAAAGAALYSRDAGGLLHHRGKIDEILILHSLLSDHTHRLRCLADRLRHLAADRESATGVALRILGRSRVGAAIDACDSRVR